MQVNSELYQLLSSAALDCDQASIDALGIGSMMMVKIGEYDLLWSLLGEHELVVSTNVIKGINNSANYSKLLSTLGSALPFYSQMNINLYLCPLTQDVTEGKELAQGQVLYLEEANLDLSSHSASALSANEFFNLKLELNLNVAKYGLEQQQVLISDFCSLCDYLKERYRQAF